MTQIQTFFIQDQYIYYNEISKSCAHNWKLNQCKMIWYSHVIESVGWHHEYRICHVYNLAPRSHMSCAESWWRTYYYILQDATWWGERCPETQTASPPVLSPAFSCLCPVSPGSAWWRGGVLWRASWGTESWDWGSVIGAGPCHLSTKAASAYGWEFQDHSMKYTHTRWVALPELQLCSLPAKYFTPPLLLMLTQCTVYDFVLF